MWNVNMNKSEKDENTRAAFLKSQQEMKKRNAWLTCIGELEFNEKWFHFDGAGPSFLFIGTDSEGYITYCMSYKDSPHVGNMTKFKNHITLYEFLKLYVNTDVRHSQEGRGVIQSFANCRVRLKGFAEWIERDIIHL